MSASGTLSVAPDDAAVAVSCCEETIVTGGENFWLKQRLEAARTVGLVDKSQRDDENEEREIDCNGVSDTNAGNFKWLCMAFYERRVVSCVEQNVQWVESDGSNRQRFLDEVGISKTEM